MDGINNAKAVVEPWWTYFNYCFSEHPFAAVCGPFREHIVVAIVAIGVIAVVVGTWTYLSYRRRDLAAMRAQAKREAVADEETMRAHQWNGDKAYQADIPDDELQQRMREGIEQRKREAQTRRGV